MVKKNGEFLVENCPKSAENLGIYFCVVYVVGLFMFDVAFVLTISISMLNHRITHNLHLDLFGTTER